MQIQCPTCSRVIIVPDGSAGQIVACPSCQGQMQVPAAAAPAAVVELQPAGTAGEPTKPCPFCGETILKVARKCRFCKADIPEGADPEAIRSRLAAKEKKLAAQRAGGGMPPISYAVGGKLRILTFVALGLLVLFTGLAVPAFMHGAGGMVALGVFCVVGAIIAGLSVIVAAVHDALTPAASARTTPEAGLKAFLQAVRFRRFRYAHACLLGGEKDGLPRARQPIPEVKIIPGSFAFNQLKSFAAYWKGMASASGGYNRRMIVSQVTQEGEAGDFATVRATVKFESSPIGLALCILLGVPGLIIMVILIAVLTKRHSMEITKLLRKVDGQWYVVNGELDSPEDHALAIAAAVAAEAGKPVSASPG